MVAKRNRKKMAKLGFEPTREIAQRAEHNRYAMTITKVSDGNKKTVRAQREG